MKIICIGRNYVKHAQELNHDVPTEPVFFMKPDSALCLDNKPFFLPDFSKEIHHEIELVIKINRLGKNIESKFAHRYYDEIGLGIDFTARDLQRQLIEKGLPWEKAKAFDSSAVLGKFILKEELGDLGHILFSLKRNGEIVQSGDSQLMIFPFDTIIEHVSKYVTLKIGDLIYTGTPAGVGPVAIGDRLEGFIWEKKMFDIQVK
ncbi:MAG: fumarylacetoacetate hydrolase family protein [Prolixibacteraceae bacterium]|jgi:2-keto-4-pentenoate hydratase/2-oxohepta-3-ene-1,7-dioic acid hydratase in catechol pathway|nr:fumarylacetoacetate hydrolase family protein [Prolixibacteraceae bacterium]